MSRPHPFLSYTSARILLFVAILAVLYLLGARSWLLLLLAFLLSGLLSFILLARQRDAMSVTVAERTKAMGERMDRRTRAEDEADDAWRAEQEAREAREARRAGGPAQAAPSGSAEGEAQPEQ